MIGKQRGIAAAVCLGAVLAAPAAARAQEHPQIRVGQTLNGRLESNAPAQTERGRFKVYRFTATDGQSVIVTMRSTDFDSYLTVGRVVGGILDPMRTDDDRGGEMDARVRFKAPDAGTYLIVAQSLTQEGEGAFTLQLENAPEPTTAGARQIRVGQTVTGELAATDAVLEGDESYYDTWTFNARAGERYTIEMKSSEFDTYLSFGKPNDEGELDGQQNDDDGAGEGTTDSRLRVTIPEDGQYVIRANSVGPGATGSYTLALAERVVRTQRPTPQPIRAGQTVSGALEESDAVLVEDESFYDFYSYEGHAGEVLRITMSSEEFDTFLAIGTLNGEEFTEIVSNDDREGGEDGTNSFIEVTLPSDGRFVIRANSLSGDTTGPYTLRVETSRDR